MKNSLSDKKKQHINAKLNSILKADDFSEVSEEGSRDESEEKESIDEELTWTYFHESKLKIESIVLELVPKYSEYRKILYDTLKEICQQANLTQYDYSKLAKDEKQSQQLEKINKIESIPLDEKINTIEKIISERRIKKYYKNKHEINFQDELDPEDDQREIYRFYQETFFNNSVEATPKEQKMAQKPQSIYNQQYLSPVSQRNPNPQSKLSSIQNKVLDLSNQYQIQIDESFQRMKYQNQQVNNNKKINYTKVNDPNIGFQHELSFDVKNEQYFVNNTNRYQLDSFGFPDDQRNQINSEINYDAEKMKKFMKSSKNVDKQADQLSHTDNIYKNFIEKQNEELSKQKLRVQELTQKALKVLNNDLENDESKNEQTSIEQDKIAQLRYLLGEIIEIFSVEQCLKYNLKFKSFELLNKLYENASLYYNQEITFEEPLEVKYLSQIVKAALPDEEEEGIRIIIRNIFDSESSIAYQDFLERLTPSINDKEFESLQSASYTATSNKTFDLSVRLFNVWIEIDYFIDQLKSLLDTNQEIIDRFIEQTTENALLMPHLIAEFISKSKKFPKSKKVKAEIFFRKILGEKLIVSEFYRWVDSKSSKLNANFEKLQEEDKYDYHLY